ncbi:MAG: hypothetical protein J6Y57_10620 [Lachnospiraceae bacterium]|nr:hypothetical protein [Lachnospiraceae bacterium]
MKRLIKTGSILAAALIYVLFTAGCGTLFPERQIGIEARYYCANKYGFRPGLTDVQLRKVGELEGVWHKKDAGTANMSYLGRTFQVYVSLEDPEVRYDNYLQPDLEEYLTAYFADALACEDIQIWATYGVPVCMVPGDVKTVEDIFAKCDNIVLYVSTVGLNRENAKDLNVTEFGSNTEINIIDWTSNECLADWDLMRETVVGLESDSYTNGFSKFSSFYQYRNGDVRSLEK